MMLSKETPLSSNERSFLLSSLASSGLRIDGRTATDWRQASINFPGGSGLVEVRLGSTKVVAVTTADLIQPFPDRPNEGNVNIVVNFSPIAAPNFEPGTMGERGMEIARIIDRGIRDSRALDTESLCVLAGQKVWSIRCDLHVLDAEGNILDALNLAAVTSLAHFRRPDVTVVGESVTVHSVDDRQPVALAMHHLPMTSSFAFFDRKEMSNAATATPAQPSSISPAPSTTTAAASNPGDDSSSLPLFVVDPIWKEEQVSHGGLTITLNIHGELCCMQKGGGLGVGVESILHCSSLAQTRTEELTRLVQRRLKEDAEAQNTGNAVRGAPGSEAVGSIPSTVPPLSSPSSSSASKPPTLSSTQKAKPIYHQSTSAAPIDAFGTNPTKSPGQHLTAGKPIELHVKGMHEDDDDDDEVSDEEDEDDSEEDSRMEDEDDDDDHHHSAAAAEFQQVAKKLQQQHQQQQKSNKMQQSSSGKRRK